MCCMFAALVVLCIVLSDGEDMKDQKMFLLLISIFSLYFVTMKCV